MSPTTQRAATIDDLYRVDGKAELIAGRIVRQMATGRKPGRVAARIARSLDDHAEATGRGEAYIGTIGFVVPALASGRQSFSPDASYFLGPFPEDGMQFLRGAPTFAVEVRSENDVEEEMAAKRRDDFEAGTGVVWDVVPVAECIHVYCNDAPDRPAMFRRGEEADAEPAVPGWRLAVDGVFAPGRAGG